MSIIAIIILVYLILGLVTFSVYVTTVETDPTISLIAYFLAVMTAWPLYVYPIIDMKRKK